MAKPSPRPADDKRGSSAAQAARHAGWLFQTLIAVLVICALVWMASGPILRRAQDAKHKAVAVKSARSIFLALQSFAQDHDGRFPAAQRSSNEAFRKLFPGYAAQERLFFMPGSAWHQPTGGKGGDEDTGTPPDHANCLAAGENHWACVSGLTTTSPSALPLLAEGFSELPGVYATSPTRRGGLTEGRTAIVVSVDGSVQAAQPDVRTLRIMNKKDGVLVDIFSAGWGTDPAAVLNPE